MICLPHVARRTTSSPGKPSVLVAEPKPRYCARKPCMNWAWDAKQGPSLDRTIPADNKDRDPLGKATDESRNGACHPDGWVTAGTGIKYNQWQIRRWLRRFKEHLSGHWPPKPIDAGPHCRTGAANTIQMVRCEVVPSSQESAGGAQTGENVCAQPGGKGAS